MFLQEGESDPVYCGIPRARIYGAYEGETERERESDLAWGIR